MAKLTFDAPENALSALCLSPNEFAREIRVAAALLWYSRGEISQSIGAAIADVSRAEFIDELARRHIPLVQATIGNWKKKQIASEEVRRERQGAIHPRRFAIMYIWMYT